MITIATKYPACGATVDMPPLIVNMGRINSLTQAETLHKFNESYKMTTLGSFDSYYKQISCKEMAEK